MPIPAAGYFLLEGGFFDLPYIFPIFKTIPFLFLFYVLKVFFGGASNTSERDMHSKVIMITVRLSPLTLCPRIMNLILAREAHPASAPQ